jgi:hypothetical protein
MRYAPRALLAGGLGFAASLLVACGGSAGLLSTDQASTLNAALDQVSSAVQANNCGAASSAATSLTNAVQNLPSSINPTLTSDLNQGVATVQTLAARDCGRVTTTTTKTTPPTTTKSTTTTTSSTTTTTSTTPTIPTTTTSTTTTTTPATTTTATGTTSTGTSGGVGPGGGGGNGNGQ